MTNEYNLSLLVHYVKRSKNYSFKFNCTRVPHSVLRCSHKATMFFS